MLTFTLPQLYSPFTPQFNPCSATTHRHIMEWVERYQLFSPEVRCHLPAIQYAELMARTFPTVSAEALDFVADWNVWLFARDDILVETGIGRDPDRLADFNFRSLEILHGAPATADDSLLNQALGDFCQTLRSVATPACQSRFIRTVEDHFMSNIWEAIQYAEGYTPDLASYRMMRPFTGAVYTDFALIEIAGAFELSPEVHRHPLIQRLNLIGCNVVCFANDLFSLVKEIEDSETMNLVVVIKNEYELSLQEAVDHAAAIYNAEVRAFEIMEAQLSACGLIITPDVQRYVDGLRAWMRGNLDWSIASGRYNVVPQMQEVAG